MLRDLRAHIESLAVDDGEYTLIGSRYGEQPVPATGLWFPTRQIARTAARATTQYRNALRQYDPTLPQYDVVVCQGHPSTVEPLTDRPPSAPSTSDAPTSPADDVPPRPTPAAGSDKLPRRTDTPLPSAAVTATATRPLVQFCHHVAAAVFETLAAEGYDAAETAVMDAYFEHAEAQSTPDELCLRLLESMATVLATRLPPDEQATVLSAAADRLPPTAAVPPTESETTSVVFERLRERGVIGAYHDTPWLQQRSTGTQAVLVEIAGYAFSPHGDQLPTLPIVIELYRVATDWQPVVIDVTALATGWRLRVVPGGEATPQGLVSAQISPDEPGCP